MEWSRAKTILIILFLILNVFLFASILYSNSGPGADSDYIKNVNALLKSKNIKIDADIPSYHSATGSILYENKTIDANRAVDFFFVHSVSPVNKAEASETVWMEGDKILEAGKNIIKYNDGSPEKALSLNDRDRLMNELDPYFTSLGIDRDDYAADVCREEKDGVYLKFIKKYNGQFLYDIYIDFYITPSGVQSMNMVPKDAVSAIVRDDILSAYQVLAVGAIHENSVIKGISFGYKKIQEGDFNGTPVWRIRYSDNHDEYFNAYTGEKLGN